MQTKSKKRFHIILVKPSRYDDDGYVVRWFRGIIASSSLACLYGLTEEFCAQSGLGPEVETVIHVFDDTIQKIPVARLSRKILRAGERAVVCLVGVQTNQYARALDLGLAFRREGLPCMIGGFHVSGILAMLPEVTPEIQRAMDHGMTVVAGEVEARWGYLLTEAFQGRLKPLYKFIREKPDLGGYAASILPDAFMRRFLNKQTSFDAGRGCPFRCSFCTIINVQGNAMRGRNEADIEKIVRRHHAEGSTHLFITDDNFARHKHWEKIADRLIEMKEKENIRCSLMIQTDTMAHKIPGFIEKMTRAGVRRVFIGMESVNPDNLKEVSKPQNQLSEYRVMLQKWRDHGALTCAGYIIGFPGDTYESVMRDIEFLKNEIPLDLAEFFMMTPLPGSRDHQQYALNKVAMAEDTNLYDSAHVTMKHPRMTDEELMRAYRDAWKSFYSREHCRTLFLRRKGPRRRLLFASLVWFCGAVFLTDVHPLLGGMLRLKGRKERRKGYPVEPFFPYYFKRFWESTVYFAGLAKLGLDLWGMKREADRPENAGYEDKATRPQEKACG